METSLTQAAQDVRAHQAQLSETLDELDQRVSSWIEHARTRAEAPERWVRRNPLVAAAVVAALGFVIGCQLEGRSQTRS
jgi:ElaB/YqjD/DUF883 family membrane-anchored ribosome-binding protein